MPRLPRYLISGSFYEVIFHAREDLPLPTRKIINAIIVGVMARAQRDNKVTLCHYVWMGNHAHLGYIIHDADSAVKFYQEIQKKITDSLKALLDREHLNIWQGRPVVALIADPEAAVEKIAYWYANPAQADLVESIDEYPGVTSWSDYRSTDHELDACCSREVPWIQIPAIPRLPSRRFSPRQDEHFTQRALDDSTTTTTLELWPNAWMRVFGITEPEKVREYNERIIQRLREKEAKARELRKRKAKGVVGAKALLKQDILQSFLPKGKTNGPRDRQVYIITKVQEIRYAFIETLRYLREFRRKLYHRWKNGDRSVKWPPGIYVPGSPPIANSIVQPAM